jgi:transcriptional regulator with XRE-family HTH domain
MEAWAILTEARSRSGLTQRELARRARTSQAAIARYERGRAIPSLSVLNRIARACGFDLRVDLAPRDTHDDTLIDLMLAMTVEARFRTAGNYAVLASQLRGA